METTLQYIIALSSLPSLLQFISSPPSLLSFPFLYTCRSFAKPPPPVQTICECVALFRGFKDPDWKIAKGMMADTSFLSSLQNMDVDGITGGQVRDTCTHVLP